MHKFNKIVIDDVSVSIKDIEAVIIDEQFIKVGSKSTVCILTLTNGFEVIGISSVVNPDLFNFELGSKIARDKAIDKVWGHLGFALQNQL